MNKKLLMFTLIPLVLFVMVAPVMAKPVTKSLGPQKALGKNPHVMSTPEGVEALLPSGGVHSWTNDTEVWCMDFMHALDASKAKIPNALPLTIEYLMDLMINETAALEAENKWGYMSHDVLVQMLILEGLEPEEAEAMAAIWPEGIYVRYVNVGK